MRSLSVAALLAVSFVVLAAAPRQDPTLVRQTRRVMGSLAEIQVYHADAAAADRAVADALDEMARIDRLLSNYQADTELSRMNAGAGKAPFIASPELYDFVTRCRVYFDETLGTFDPTMGPIVRAWGFFTPRAAQPAPDAIAAAKAHSGFGKVRLVEASRTVAYAVDGVELDPGGIGKGYAADRAVSVLQRAGITSALVNAGGSTLYGIGHPPNQSGWKVAVRNPASPATSLRYVVLRDNALSTSGISGKYVEIGGRRYGHIIDPRTKEPTAGLCQVTMTAPNATDSDALTKAAFLLTRDELVRLFGKRQGVHLLRVEGGCEESGTVWTTPWSEGVFLPAAGAVPAK